MIGAVERLFDLHVFATVHGASGIWQLVFSIFPVRKRDLWKILTIDAESQVLLRPRDVMPRSVAIADVAFDVCQMVSASLVQIQISKKKEEEG